VCGEDDEAEEGGGVGKGREGPEPAAEDVLDFWDSFFL
jgi:hypothetical protein